MGIYRYIEFLDCRLHASTAAKAARFTCTSCIIVDDLTTTDLATYNGQVLSMKSALRSAMQLFSPRCMRTNHGSLSPCTTSADEITRSLHSDSVMGKSSNRKRPRGQRRARGTPELQVGSTEPLIHPRTFVLCFFVSS